MKTHLAASAAVLLSFLPSFAADPGAIRGVVVTRAGDPAAGTRVSIPQLRVRAVADAEGAFRFAAVPPGHYDLEAMNPRFGTAVYEVDVEEGKTAEIRIRLDLGVHTATVVVTASPEARSAVEIAQPTSVYDGPDLQAKIAPSLGETLATIPGISATSYAPGTSRPIIRGFSGDRIRILENGLGTGDASNVSPDHAVSTDPLAADRIEIVRGPASLLYGNAAVGGVVNVLDSRVPDHRSEQAVSGIADLRLGSAADERAAALRLSGGRGAFAWQAHALDRRAGDLETPSGRLSNSDLDARSVSAGGSYVGSNGFVGLAVSDYSTNYGVAIEEDVRVDLDRERVDLRGEWSKRFGPFRSLKARFGLADYEHRELEGTEVGTVFTNEAWEGRVELAHVPIGPFNGTIGIQATERDFAAIGDEAFVEPTTTDTAALFVFEEVGEGNFRGELGLRYERQRSKSADPTLPDRDFDAGSASAGIVWLRGDDWAAAASLSRTTRLPSPEELYSNGPHVATNAFEIGDPDLGNETGYGLDLSLRKRAGRVNGELTLFWNEISDYIYDRDTGVVDPDDGLPIFRFVQEDARFRGAEFEIHIELIHADPHHLEVEVRADLVRAELTDRNEPLPRIPPVRVAVGLRYQGSALWAEIEGARVGMQDRVAPGETATSGYTWLNATAGVRILGKRLVHDLILRGTNLTDRLARSHVSRFKDAVPLTGRDLALSYRVTF